ncbi:MAG: hypothetical protein KJ702_14310 [Gammaproteobacteria bacterium]|nr:hypothetical protein [Gammaproteobacteria bacterium]
MNAHFKPVGTDWNGFLTRIEQTDSQIRALETLVEDKRSQMYSDLAILDRHTRPIPRPLALIVSNAQKVRHPVRSAHGQRALIYKETRYPCRHYKDWFIRLCRQVREDYPSQWGAAVASLNSGCNATLRVAQSREALLPNLSADLLRAATESIGGGWYVSKQSLSKKKIETLIKMLCACVKLQCGADVILVDSKG